MGEGSGILERTRPMTDNLGSVLEALRELLGGNLLFLTSRQDLIFTYNGVFLWV